MGLVSRDIAAGIVTLWDENGLEAEFTNIWNASYDKSENVAMLDREGYPDQPLPFCNFDQGRTASDQLMSGGKDSLRDIRSTLLTFRVNVSDYNRVAGETRSSAEIGSHLAGKIQEVFGGHHLVAPPSFPVATGCHLITKYVSDSANKRVFTGSKEKLDFRGVIWTINYEIMVDVAVAA